jgi:hypothetical protein
MRYRDSPEGRADRRDHRRVSGSGRPAREGSGCRHAPRCAENLRDVRAASLGRVGPEFPSGENVMGKRTGTCTDAGAGAGNGLTRAAITLLVACGGATASDRVAPGQGEGGQLADSSSPEDAPSAVGTPDAPTAPASDSRGSLHHLCVELRLYLLRRFGLHRADGERDIHGVGRW